MEKIFNKLINSFINNKAGIAENFLSEPLSLQLKANLQTLYASQQMQSAGTGGNTNVHYNHLFRSDIIYWLDREHNNVHENTFFDHTPDIAYQKLEYIHLNPFTKHWRLTTEPSDYFFSSASFYERNERSSPFLSHLRIGMIGE